MSVVVYRPLQPRVYLKATFGSGFSAQSSPSLRCSLILYLLTPSEPPSIRQSQCVPWVMFPTSSPPGPITNFCAINSPNSGTYTSTPSALIFAQPRSPVRGTPIVESSILTHPCLIPQNCSLLGRHGAVTGCSVASGLLFALSSTPAGILMMSSFNGVFAWTLLPHIEQKERYSGWVLCVQVSVCVIPSQISIAFLPQNLQGSPRISAAAAQKTKGMREDLHMS